MVEALAFCSLVRSSGPIRFQPSSAEVACIIPVCFVRCNFFYYLCCFFSATEAARAVLACLLGLQSPFHRHNLLHHRIGIHPQGLARPLSYAAFISVDQQEVSWRLQMYLSRHICVYTALQTSCSFRSCFHSYHNSHLRMLCYTCVVAEHFLLFLIQCRRSHPS